MITIEYLGDYEYIVTTDETSFVTDIYGLMALLAQKDDDDE